MFRDSYVLCIYVMNILCTFSIFMYRYATVLLQAILFSISTQHTNIWPADRTISGATTPPVQAESQQHSLEQAARDIGLSVNSDKTDLMRFNQDDALFSLKWRVSEISTSVVISHLLKLMSAYALVKCGLLLTCDWWWRIKREFLFFFPLLSLPFLLFVAVLLFYRFLSFFFLFSL